MAGYVIHLAVAETYRRKYPEDIQDYNQFIEGVIFPDSVSTAHTAFQSSHPEHPHTYHIGNPSYGAGHFC